MASSPVVRKERIYGHRVCSWVDMMHTTTVLGSFITPVKQETRSQQSKDGGGNMEERKKIKKENKSLGNGK